MYTIYINNKPFIITDDWDLMISDTSYLHHYNDNAEYIGKITREFVNSNKHKGLILHASSAVGAFEKFCSHYDIVEAAGGVVENELQQVLLIHRKGCWDLPKGRIEEGESEAQAARREVMEECGIKQVETGPKLLTTYHTFYMPQKNVLKVSHWFAMKCSSEEKIVPQTEEDITEIKWFVKSLLDLSKLDTYSSIHEVLYVYLNKKSVPKK